MTHRFTLEYWPDGDWLVGRLREVPSVFSQGATLDELRENVQEVYELLIGDSRSDAPPAAQRCDVEVEV